MPILTDEERTVMESEIVSTTWQAWRVNNANVPGMELTNHLSQKGSYLSRNVKGKRPGRGSLRWDEYVIGGEEQVKVRINVKDEDSDARFSRDLGIWVCANPTSNLDVTNALSTPLTDKVSRIDTETGVQWTISDEVNVRDAVLDMVAASDPTFPTEIPYVDLRTAREAVWLLDDRTTWREMMNEVLYTAGYAAVYTTNLGCLTTYPWRPLDELEPIWTFSENDENAFILKRTRVRPKRAVIPNIWIGIVSSVDSPLRGASFEIRNEVDGPHSIQAVGREIKKIVTLDAITQEAIEAQLRFVVEQDRRSVRVINIECAKLPIFWHADVVYCDFPSFGIDAKGIVTDWNIPMDSGNMRLTVEIGD